jgi:hypothetical protein
MKKTAPILILAATLLAGCAGWDEMDQGMRSLQGQPLQAAVQRLGYPAAEERIAGMRLVVWSLTRSSTEDVSQTATTHGVKKNKNGHEKYQETTQYAVPVVRLYNCTIKLEVGDDNIIRGGNYDGDIMTCQRYINALNGRRSFLDDIL